jgi:tetratricopeptide (TPR) repeat protein
MHSVIKPKRETPIAGFLLTVACLAFSSPAATTNTATGFPVETIVYHALTASFLENPRLIQRNLDALTSYDLTLESRGYAACGLTDNLAWLWAESLATPETRTAGYRKVLERPTDLLVNTNVRAALSQTPTARIRDAHRQDVWDRWADLINAAGHNLGRLVNGQMIGSAKFLVELVYSPTQFTKVTERERKEWWLIDTCLRFDPKGPETEHLRERMAELETKFRKDAIRKCMDVARFYADRGWWDEAYFYVRAAEEAGYRGKSKFRRQVRAMVANQKRWTEQSLAVADTERFVRTPDQVGAYGDLLKTLTLGNRDQLRQSAGAAGRALTGTPLADETQDAWSIVFEWAGDRRTALNVQRDLALRYPEEQAGRAALARLDDPQYNPRARYDQEKSQFRGRQSHYVFTGERTTRQNIELISQLATPSAPQLGMAGAFFVTDVLLRSILVSFGNPVSSEDVLAAGEQLLADPRNGLTPDEEADVRVSLGVLYQKLRRYEDAAAAYRAARILSPELDKNLAERAADEQFRRILEMENVNRQVLLLERLISTYPKTDAAGRARDQLARLRTETKVDFEIPHDWLAEDPIHWMKLGVRIPYELMDGVRGNGEVDDRGLVFWRDVPSSATYVCVDGKKGYVNLTPRRRAILQAAAAAWVDEKAALEEGEITLATRRVPFEVRGSLGAEGLIVFPTIHHAPLTDQDKQLFR